MQDRYAGDIGDFVKFAILRALAPGHRVGIVWWLFPDETHNGDGRHTGYLTRPEVWRALDPGLFDGLQRVVEAGARTVAALEQSGFIPSAKYFTEAVSSGGPLSSRAGARNSWLERARQATRDCDILFLDPDNGLEPRTFGVTKSKAGKSVALTELCALQEQGRTLVVYHHQTRMAGGHLEELAHWGRRLRAEGFARVDALRAPRFSPRAFFLLDAPPQLQERAASLAAQWGEGLTWHPDLGAAPGIGAVDAAGGGSAGGV